MHKIIEWVKKHPWETGLIVFGIGLIFILLRSGSSSSATSTGTSVDPNADALAAASLQSQTQIATANIGAGVAQTQIAAGVTNTTTAGNVQENADSLSAQTSQVIAGLEAGVENNATSAGLQESLAQTSALQNIALAPYQLEEDELNSQGNARIEDEIGALANFVNVGLAESGGAEGTAPVIAAGATLTAALSPQATAAQSAAFAASGYHQ